MNLTIQRPSKILKIKLSEAYEDLNTVETDLLDGDLKIDFYNLFTEDTDIGTKKCLFAAEADVEKKSFTERADPKKNAFAEETAVKKNRFTGKTGSKPVFFDKNEKINFFTENEPLTNSLFAEKYEVERGTLNVRRPTKLRLSRNFILTALKNDLRVKEYKCIDGHIYVYLFTLEDSISFFTHYYNYNEISFSYIYEFDFLSIDWSCKEEFPRENLLDRLGFNQRVEYFSELKNYFSKIELKKMQASLDMGDISFLFINSKELSVGYQSNKIVQNAIKLMNQNELQMFIEELGYDIVPISSTKHGAYTIQMLITAVTCVKTQSLISKYFKNTGKYLIAHEIGNYTIQKILKFDAYLVLQMFLENFYDVLDNALGLKVFKRCYENFSEYYDEICDTIRRHRNRNNKALCDQLINYMMNQR